MAGAIMGSLLAALLAFLGDRAGDEPAAMAPAAVAAVHVEDRLHEGHPLCIHEDVAPVSRFHDDYTDPLGSHYHGWLPPAGPPFYVLCFDGAARMRAE